MSQRKETYYTIYSGVTIERTSKSLPFSWCFVHDFLSKINRLSIKSLKIKRSDLTIPPQGGIVKE